MDQMDTVFETLYWDTERFIDVRLFLTGYEMQQTKHESPELELVACKQANPFYNIIVQLAKAEQEELKKR